MKLIKSTWAKALALLLALTIVCGLLYPLLITGIAQIFFPEKANGSIIDVNGKQYGSILLAQEFTGDRYLWGRVMALDTKTYKDQNGKVLLYAAPANLSPASEEYTKLIKERIAKIKAADPDKADTPIPEDLVTCSASGLDPHISPAAAAYQVNRLAKARNMTADAVKTVIKKYTSGKFLGLFGEETVNVLEVNLALDGVLK